LQRKKSIGEHPGNLEWWGDTCKEIKNHGSVTGTYLCSHTYLFVQVMNLL